MNRRHLLQFGIASTAGSLLRPVPAVADERLQKRLQEALEEATRRHGVPGAATAVVQGGRIVAAAATGVQSLATRKPARPDDPFVVGSLMSVVLGTLAARMVDRGTLRWESTFGGLFPELEATPAHLRKATLYDVCCNASGIPGGVNYDHVAAARRAAASPTEARLRFVTEYVLKMPPADPRQNQHGVPGSYTGAAMLERAARRPLEELFRTELFDPLGLRAAGMYEPWDEKGQPFGLGAHERGADGTLRAIPLTYRTQVSVYMSASDLATVGMEHLAAARGVGRLLSARQAEIAQRRHPRGIQAPCWWCGEAATPGRLSVETGNQGGTCSLLRVDRATGLVLAAYANLQSHQGGSSCLHDAWRISGLTSKQEHR